MGNGTTALGSDGGKVYTITPVTIEGELPKVDKTDKANGAAIAPAVAPKPEDYKKLIAKAQSLGIKLDFLDDKGNIKPEKLQEVKTRVAKAMDDKIAQAAPKNVKPSDPLAATTVFLPPLLKNSEFVLLPKETQLALLKEKGYANPEKIVDAIEKDYPPNKKFAHAIRLEAQTREAKGGIEDKKDAARLFDTASAFDPSNADIHRGAFRNFKAWADAEPNVDDKKKLYASAAAHLDPLVKANPKDGELLKTAGQVYQGLGNTAESEKYFGAAQKELTAQFKEKYKAYQQNPGHSKADMEAKQKPLADLIKQMKELPDGDSSSKFEKLVCIRDFERARFNSRVADYPDFKGPYIETTRYTPYHRGSALINDGLDSLGFDMGHTEKYSNPDPKAKADYEAKKTTDFATARTELDAAEKEIQKLQTDLRAKVDDKSLPPADRIAAGKQAIQFSKTLGDNKGRVQDLDHLKSALDSFGYSDLHGAPRVQAYSELLGEWHTFRTEMTDPSVIDMPSDQLKERFTLSASEATDRMRNIAPRIRESCDYIQTKDAMDKVEQMLNRLIDLDDKKLLPFLSSEGIEKYTKASSEADQKFEIAKTNLANAKTPEDVKKARGDLLVALTTYSALRDRSKADDVVKAMESTLKTSTPTEKLEVYTALASVLKDSDFSSYTDVKDKGRAIAGELSRDCLTRTVFSDTQTPVDDAKKLLLAKTFFETVGDKDAAKLVNTGLDKLGDKILNILYSPDPKIKPTDPKTRVELASLVVQMDQSLLETAVADAGKPDSTGPIVNTVQSARLGVLRRELEKAKDLPFEFKLDQYKRLAGAAATYKSLTEPIQKDKGQLAIIDAGTLKTETEAIGKLGDSLITDALTPKDDAKPEVKAMAARMTEDLKARLHQALDKGEVSWLTQLTPNSMAEFAMVSGKANRLLDQAKALPPDRAEEAMSLYIEAGKQFGLLGLGGRVSETMKPVLDYARGLSDPMQKAAGFLAVSQVFQEAKMTPEANGALQELVDLDKAGASQDVKDVAQLARGMQKLNDGKLDEAKELLKSLPKNELAKALLQQITDGQKTLRTAQSVEVVRIVFASKAQAMRDKGKTAQADQYEKAAMGALDEAKRLVLAGKCDTLEGAFRRVMYDSRFSGADLGDFFFETGPGWKTWDFIRASDDPRVSTKDFGELSLSFAKRMVDDKYYGAADAIAGLFVEDAYVKDKAVAFRKDLPDQVKVDGIFKTLKSLVAMNPVGAFLSITFTPKELGSDEDPVKEILTDVGIGVATFGIGKGFAVAADAIYVSRAASLLSRPIAYNVLRWGVKSGAEATGFVLGGMTAQTILTGKTDHWTLSHFGTEWGSMIVMFGLMHGVGMGLGKFGKYAEGKGWMESPKFQAGFKGVQYTATIGAFTGSEYINEALGLKKKENTPLYLRIFGSMVTDALMKKTGKIFEGTLESATLGKVKLGEIEKNTQSTYEAQIQTKKMGIDPGSADGKLVVDAMLGKGESLSAEAQKRYGDAVKDLFHTDPKSEQGKELATLLFFYGHRAGEKSGKPMTDGELTRAAHELDTSVKMLIKGSGIAEGKESDVLRAEILRMALENGVKPEAMEQFAKHAPDMKDRLHDIVNTIFGPGGSKTAEGQKLMSALLVKALSETSDPAKTADALEGLAHAGTDTGDALRFTVNTILGKGASGTPEGRELMGVLLMNAMGSAKNPADIPDKIGELGVVGVETGEALRGTVDSILGPKGSQTAEGRKLAAVLLLKTLSNTENASDVPSKLGETKAFATEAGDSLRANVSYLLGGKASESPQGRAMMVRLFLDAATSADRPSDIPKNMEKISDALNDLSVPVPNIFDLAGAKTPEQKFALLQWSMETGQTPKSLQELADKALKGEVEFTFKGSKAGIRDVPADRQAAAKKAVFDRLPFEKLDQKDLKHFGEERVKFYEMLADPKTALDPQALQAKLDAIKTEFKDYGKELEKEFLDMQIHLNVSAHDELYGRFGGGGFEAKFNKGARCWTEGSGDQKKYFYEYQSAFGPVRKNLSGERMKIFFAYERWAERLSDKTADSVLAKLPSADKGKAAQGAAEEPLPMAARKDGAAAISVKQPPSSGGPALSLVGGTMKDAMELGGEFGFTDKTFLKQVGRDAEPGKFDRDQAKKAFQAIDAVLPAADALQVSTLRRNIFLQVVQGKMSPEQAVKLAEDIRAGRKTLEVGDMNSGQAFKEVNVPAAEQTEVAREAAIRIALTEAGVNRANPKPTDLARISDIRVQLNDGFKNGTLTVEDLHKVSGKELSAERRLELEGKLGVKSSEWLDQLAKDPAGFKSKFETAVKALDWAKDPANPASKGVGNAQFKPITDIEAKAGKIAQGAPSADRIRRYEDHLVKNKGYDRAQAHEAAKAWAEKVIVDARAHQAGKTHIYDTSLPAKPENLHMDKATVDHHGRFANPKNSTEQLVDRMEFTLDAVKKDSKAIADAKNDPAAMDSARKGLEQAGIKNPSEQQVAEIAAALRTMNLKEVTTDNLADGGWSVWMAKNQGRVLADPALRKLITDATHFEDFTAFGTTYSEKDPGVRLQAALFQKYGAILKANGIVGSDRFPPDKADKVMGEALKAIDEMVADPTKREAAATEFFAKVEEGRKIVLEQGVMKDVSVTQGDTQLIFVDLTKLGDLTVFQQWLAIPRAEVVPGKPHTMQVSVVPLGKAKMADGKEIDASRTLQIVAIPDGRSLPSGKGMLTAVDRVNARELAKAEELGLVPKEGQEPGPGQVPRDQYAKVWFGKDSVILPNPGKGTLLSPKEVSDIMTDRSLQLGEKPLDMFQTKEATDAAKKEASAPPDPNSLQGVIGGDAALAIKAGLPAGSSLGDKTIHVQGENVVLADEALQKQLEALPDNVKKDPNAYLPVHIEVNGFHHVVLESYKNLSNPHFSLALLSGKTRSPVFQLDYRVQGDTIHLDYIGRGNVLKGGEKGIGEGAFRGFVEHLQTNYPGAKITTQAENIKVAEFFTQYLDSAQGITIGKGGDSLIAHPIDTDLNGRVVDALRDQGYLTADQALKLHTAGDRFEAHDLFFKFLKENQQAAATDGKTTAKNEVAYLLEGLGRCPEPLRKAYIGTLWIEAKIPTEAGPPSSKPKGGGDNAPATLRSTGTVDPGLARGFADRGERIIPNAEFGNILVDAKGELIRPASDAEQKAYLQYKTKFGAESKKLNAGFDKGEKIIPDGKGGWVLNGADGKAIRYATGQEQQLYIDYKKDQASKEVAQKALVRGFAENGEKILPDKEYGQVLVNRDGELLRPASKAELRSYLDYKKGADLRAKELGEGFKAGNKIIPDGKDGWVLNGPDGKTIRPATSEEQGMYLSYKVATDAATRELEAGFAKGQRIIPDGKGGNVLVEPQTDGSVKTLRAATPEEQGMYLAYKKAVDTKAAQADRQTKALEAGFYVRGERIIPDKKYGNILVDRNGELIRPASHAEQGQYLKWKTSMDRLEDLTPDAKAEPPPLPLEARFKYGQKVLGPYQDGKYYFVNKSGERVGEANKEQSIAYVAYKRKAAPQEPVDVTQYAKMEPPPLPFEARLKNGEKVLGPYKDGKYYFVNKGGERTGQATKEQSLAYVSFKKAQSSEPVDVTAFAKMEPPPLPKRGSALSAADKTSAGTPSALSGKKVGSALPAQDKTNAGTPSALSGKKVKTGGEGSGVKDKGSGTVETPTPTEFTPLPPLEGGPLLHGQPLYDKAGAALKPYLIDANGDASPQALRLAELGKLPGGAGEQAVEALRLLDMIRIDATNLKDANHSDVMAKYFSDRLTTNLARLDALTTQFKPALEGKPLDPAAATGLQTEAKALGGELFDAQLKRAAGDEDAKAPQWVQQIDVAIMVGDPAVSARAKEVRLAADGIPKTLGAIDALEADLKAGKVPADQKVQAEKNLGDLYRVLEGQTAVVKGWKADEVKVRSIGRGMRDLNFPYVQDSVRIHVRENDLIPDQFKPEGPNCPLDFAIPIRDQDTYPMLRANLYGSLGSKVSPTESNTVVFEVKDAAGQKAMTDYVTKDLKARFPDKTVSEESPGLLRITQKDGTEFFVQVEIYHAKTEAGPVDLQPTTPPPGGGGSETVKPGKLGGGDGATVRPGKLAPGANDGATVKPGKLGAAPLADGTGLETVRPGKPPLGDKTVVVSYTDATKVGGPDAKLLDDATPPGTPLKLEFNKAGDGAYAANQGGLKFTSLEDNSFVVQSTDGNAVVINGRAEGAGKAYALAKGDFIQVEGKNYIFTGTEIVKADPFATPTKTSAPKSFDLKKTGASEPKDFPPGTDEVSGVRPKTFKSSTPPPPSDSPKGSPDAFDLANPVIPKAPKMPGADLYREAEVSLSIYNKVFPAEQGVEGREAYVGREFIAELGRISATMSETGNPEIAQKMEADLKTMRTSEVGSEAYNQALDRLATVIKVRRYGQDLGNKPVENGSSFIKVEVGLMNEGTLSQFSKALGKVYSLEAKPSHVADVGPASSKKGGEVDEWADFADPGAKPAAGKDKATLPPPPGFDPVSADKEASGPVTVVPKPYFPKALDVLAEPGTGDPTVKVAPTPRQVLGGKVMDAVKATILSDPEINKKGQIQATDVHEISCNLSDLKPTIEKIASQTPKDQLPKTLYFIADMKRPDGSHVVSLVKHEMHADGESRTSPNNGIFTFNYRVTEGSNGEPTRVRVDYIKAREDLRGKVVTPAVNSLMEFAAKEYPGATIETRADNLISAQLAGANLSGTRFIEVTDSKKYPVSKMIEPGLVDQMTKAQVLTEAQAKTLKEMIGQSVPEDQKGAQAVKVHNQFISFVRENYAKEPGDASNEVSFVFQKLRRSKEALAYIKESPYRGDLWVEGQVTSKATPKGTPEPLPLIKPTDTGTMAAAPAEFKAVPGGAKIGGQDYTVGVKETPDGNVYRFQGGQGGDIAVRVPQGQYVAHIDRSLGGKGDPNADPAQLTKALLGKIAAKDPKLLGKIAEYEAKTGQTLSLNTLSELSLKAGIGADKILGDAAAYQGFTFEVGMQNPQKITLTGEILGIGSNSAVYKGIVTDSKGVQTTVAVKLAPEVKAGNLIKFDKAEIGGSKFYGTAHIGVDPKNQQAYAKPVQEVGPNALVMNYSEGVLIKGFNEVPEALKDQVYREATEDLGKLVKQGFTSFYDSNFLVRTGDKVDRRLEWIDLDGVAFGQAPSAEKYPEAYRAALKQLGIPEKYWPAELKITEMPKDVQVAAAANDSTAGKADQAWMKSGDQLLDLSALNGADRRVVLAEEKGNITTTGEQDGKGLISVRQGPRSYRLDAMSGLNGSEVIVSGKDAKGQERVVRLKAPLGMALTPGEYKITVNGKEMTLNLPPISADAAPLSARAKAALSFDVSGLSETRRAEVTEALGGKDLKSLTPSEQKALALQLADQKGWTQKDLQNLVGVEGMKRYFGYGEDLPFGFQSVEQFHAFEKTLMQRLSAAGIPIHDPRVKVVIQGSAVRGSGEKGNFRWEGNPKAADKKDQPSDIDIAIIVDDSLFKEFADKRIQTIKDRRAANPTREDGHLNWNQTIGPDGKVKVTKDSKKLEKEIEKKRLGPHHLYGELGKAHNDMRDDYPMRGIQISIMTGDSKFAPTPDEAMVLSAGETSKAVGF